MSLCRIERPDFCRAPKRGGASTIKTNSDNKESSSVADSLDVVMPRIPPSSTSRLEVTKRGT